MAKLRTRKHKVVLSRSAGGDAGITVVLTLLGIFMVLPMVYVIMQAFKPLDELWMYPPKFIVMSPTLSNFKDLFVLMNASWVPFSRYIFNTLFTSIFGTFGHLFIASMCAYALAKIKFPGGKAIFKTIQTSLMFHSTVTGDRYLLGDHHSLVGIHAGSVPDEAVYGYQRSGYGFGECSSGRRIRAEDLLGHCDADG